MKKRVISILFLVLMLSAALPVLSVSAMVGPQYVNTANGKGVNIRSGPGTDFEVIGSIPYGAQAASYEYYNDSWAFISYNGNYGYCMSRYFSSTKPGAKPTPTTAPVNNSGLYTNFVKTSYYVTVRPSTPSGFVNLRWAPTKADRIQNTYYAGYQLRVLAQNSTWAQVLDEATGTCGFMMRDFLNSNGVGAAN